MIKSICVDDMVLFENDHVIVNLEKYGIYALARGIIQCLNDDGTTFHCKWYDDDANANHISNEWKWIGNDCITDVVSGLAPQMKYLYRINNERRRINRYDVDNA